MDTRAITTRGAAELTRGDVTRHPAALYLMNLRSAGGRYQMSRKLAKAADMLRAGETWQTYPWETLTAAHVGALVTKLVEAGHRPAYVNTILAAVRGVVEQAYDHELIDDKAYRLIMKVKRAQGGNAEPRGRYVTRGELEALMSVCMEDPTDAGRRDAAILACGYPGGLRRAEIAGLRRENVKDDGEMLTLMVHGKGGRTRPVPLDNGQGDAMRDWLAVRGDEPGPLFWPGRRGGHLEAGKGMTGQSVYEVLQRRAAAAGIRELGAHDLRRTTASDLLDITDAVTVAQLLGHASLDTTARYDRRGERARRKAAQGLCLPYKKRSQ